MNRIQHVVQMAAYNQWMNDKLYAAARQLTGEVLHKDLGAFFGSIFGTLNHIAVADTIWLQRFAEHPARFASLNVVRSLAKPTSLEAPLFATLDALAPYRLMLDSIITSLATEVQEVHLDQVLAYQSTKGIPGCKNLFGVLVHFFNHQTHHRGQASTLLFQQGMDIGGTDLLLLLPNLVQAP